MTWNVSMILCIASWISESGRPEYMTSKNASIILNMGSALNPCTTATLIVLSVLSPRTSKFFAPSAHLHKGRGSCKLHELNYALSFFHRALRN